MTTQFSDINSQFGVIGNLLLVEEELAVLNSILNLIRTTKGERVKNPLVGCDIVYLLYEQLDTVTAGFILDEIKYVLGFEPRARYVQEKTKISIDYDERIYYISLCVFIPGLAKEIVYPLYLRQG